MQFIEESFLASTAISSGVYLLSEAMPFEELYERTRSTERRILSDEQVALLPDGTGLWNADEWRIRKRSADRLVHSLREYAPGSRVLEVGCGNGWLSARLQREGFKVLGIDAFTTELEQAARVFPDGPAFARSDLLAAALPERSFDIIVFAASFQYFPDAQKALTRAFSLLRNGGEVHVMDSILYRSPVEKTAAVERSKKYYESLGVPEMSAYYFAHALEDIKATGRVRVLSAPSGMERTLQRFGKLASPFTHVVISAQ